MKSLHWYQFFTTLFLLCALALNSSAIPAEDTDNPNRNMTKFLGPSLTGTVSIGSRRGLGGELNLGLAYGQGMVFQHYGVTAGIFPEHERLSIGATASFIGIMSGRASLSYSEDRNSKAIDLKLGAGFLLAIAYFRLQRNIDEKSYEGEMGIEFEFPIIGAF